MNTFRNILLIVLLCTGLGTAPLLAQEFDGCTCETAFAVDTAYRASLMPGEYWFTAETPALPLTIYYYPEDPAAPAPTYYLDLTCTPGVYEDENVAHMVSMAGEYNLSFPMQGTLDPDVDEDGNVFYTILFDRNYRDMLYKQGVTYAIPAYVKLTVTSNATVDIKSTSINSQCRDYVYTLGMNTALRYAPEDSLNTYVWPLGEWIDSVYRITWIGEGKLEMFTGKDCKVERGIRVYDEYILPKDTIYMAPLKTQDWINDIYATDLYVRFYTQTEGTLRISTYEQKSKITAVTFIIDGVEIPAAIDQEAMTISVTLPAGTNLLNSIKWLSANAATAIKYEAYKGEILQVVVSRNPAILLGSIAYALNIKIATKQGNTDASLQSVAIDGRLFEDFNASTLNYKEVEATTELPQITAAVPSNEKATVAIGQITELPGTATLTVTAEAGNTQVYTINFIKGRSHDATLSSITVDGKPLADFSPENQSYRVVVKHLPVVDAVATDPLSTVTVYQAKTVPGWAQVQVKAEAGNIESYTITFSPDNSVAVCAATHDTIRFDVPIDLSLSDDHIYRMPVRSWKDSYLQLRYEGDAPLKVYALTTCSFEPEELTEVAIDTFLLSVEKGQNYYACYLRPDDLARLDKQSLQGNIYLYMPDAVAGRFTVTHFTEDCITGSVLWDLPSDNIMMSQMHNIVYKLYVPDYTAADSLVRFVWEGESPLTLYIAKHCEFKLTADHRQVLKTFELEAGLDSVDVAKALWDDWAYEVDNFFYARVVNHATGKLAVRALKKQSTGGETGIADVAVSSLDIRVLPDAALSLTSLKSQTVSLFTLTGLCLRSWQMAENETQTVQLPVGLYLLQAEDGVRKLLINNQ